MENSFRMSAIHAPYLSDKGQSNRKDREKRHADSTTHSGTQRSIQVGHCKRRNLPRSRLLYETPYSRVTTVSAAY